MWMKYLTILLCVIFSFATAHNNECKFDVKTSVIIPCYHGNARFLYSLLKLYERQTILPDEVVISLSEAHFVPEAIDKIRNEEWKFPVKVLTSDDQHYAGWNRNNGCSYSQGDILILQDADDIPHPKRVEEIIFFFKQYDLDHCVHFLFFSMIFTALC